jgi:hypothetical protein
VLTVRLNVWTTLVNPLDDFDAYRLKKFSCGENQSCDQVAEFIGKWFKSDPNLRERLIAQLYLVRHRKFRDLVTNPLLLTLLCYCWQRQPEQFPKTRAELKKQFLEALFNWNRERVSLTEASKELLINALGNLAIEMFELGASGFRFSKKLLIKFLGEPDEQQSLCWLALELGWIAPVGEANPFELVYAFFHPTFFAYFAAQVIDDWDFFLPRSHIAQPVVDETNSALYERYRVFEPQWKEVFLLWLGREDVLVKEKIDFLTALMHFKDGDGDWYEERALFLVAAGTAEFRELYQTKKLWTKESLKKLGDIYTPRTSNSNTIDEFLCRCLIDRSCGYFDEKELTFYSYPLAIQQAAKSTLLEMDEQVVCPILAEEYWAIVDLKLPQQSYPEIRQVTIASLLDQISPNSLETQKIREHFLLTFPSNDERFLLFLYYFPNWLMDLKIENIDLQKRIEKVFQPPLTLYIKTLKTAEEHFQRQGLDHKELSSTTFITKEQLVSLLELLESCSNLDSLWRAKEILEKLDPTDPEIEEILIEYCKNGNEFSCQTAASTLGKIYADSPKAVRTALEALINLIGRSKNQSIFEKALKSIEQILQSQPPEINVLILEGCWPYFRKPVFGKDTIRYSALYSISFYCAEKLPYPIFYQVLHSCSQEN